jgi:hypothetical protein
MYGNSFISLLQIIKYGSLLVIYNLMANLIQLGIFIIYNLQIIKYGSLMSIY